MPSGRSRVLGSWQCSYCLGDLVQALWGVYCPRCQEEPQMPWHVRDYIDQAARAIVPRRPWWRRLLGI